MYGLAYVILPPRYSSIQEELDRTLAPFKRGGDDVFPRELLAFDDSTADLEQLFRAKFSWQDGKVSWADDPGFGTFLIDHSKVDEYMAACRLDHFEGTYEELVPDFDQFALSFTDPDVVEGSAKRYGRWLNPLGMWDWWELGGRYNGVITGERRSASAHQFISSGESAGRSMVGNIVTALGGEPSSAEAEIEANVELAETVRQKFLLDTKEHLPLAIVLPAGCGPDRGRWFDNLKWHEIRRETREILTASDDVDYRGLVERAYEKFTDCAVAGIAYHF